MEKPSVDDIEPFPNPCLSCGACCARFRVSFYWRECDDATPMGVPAELTSDVGDFRRAMKGTELAPCRCIALQGEIGRYVHCGIYTRRPSVCRAFAASYLDGGPEPRCDQVRADHGMPPLTADHWRPLGEPRNPGEDGPGSPYLEHPAA